MYYNVVTKGLNIAILTVNIDKIHTLVNEIVLYDYFIIAADCNILLYFNCYTLGRLILEATMNLLV